MKISKFLAFVAVMILLPALTIISCTKENNGTLPKNTGEDAIQKKALSGDKGTWFDHFDGKTSWSFKNKTIGIPNGGWEKAGKWGNGENFLNLWLKGHVEIGRDSSILRLRLDEKGDNNERCTKKNPDCFDDTKFYSYASGEYRTYRKFGYGLYEAKFKASNIDGVITAFFLFKDDKPYFNIPEIDWHIFGNFRRGSMNENKGRINYYTGSRKYVNGMIDIGFDPTEDFHVYGIEWLPSNDGNKGRSAISWYADGKLVYGPVDVDFGEEDGMKVMINHWATSDSWDGPGFFKPSETQLPIYADYDWVGFIPSNVQEADSTKIKSFISLLNSN